MEEKFTYIRPYVTRALREGEADKIAVTESDIRRMESAGELLAVNFLYGVHYGTPRDPIDRALGNGRFPILDWPVESVGIMRRHYGARTFSIYLEPPGADELKSRLVQRDGTDARATKAIEEYQRLLGGAFDSVIDLRIKSATGSVEVIAKEIISAVTGLSEIQV